MKPKIRQASTLIVTAILAFTAHSVQAETLHCGLKTVTIKNGTITKIKHEDGTVHTSVSDNWSFDGKAIKHRFDDEPIPCSTQQKTREETIGELSQRFMEKPELHGMTEEEAKWMSAYTESLMKTDPKCYLLVDASKSTQRKNMFFIDCNNKAGKGHRYWVSKDDLQKGSKVSAAAPIPKDDALKLCNMELKARTSNPSTYDPALLTGSVSRVTESNGRNAVEINFTAKNDFGLERKFTGKCLFESGKILEVTVQKR